MIRSTRNQFSKSPKKMKRRRSSIPLNLKKFLSSSNIMRLNKEKLSTKNSHKDSYSIKKHCFDKINTSIPEELESFSNVEEAKKKKDSNKNDDYYLNYIKNLYENETHLNRATFIKTQSNKKIGFKKYDDSNQKLFKRRNSSVSDQLLNLNFHKKYCVEKGIFIKNIVLKKDNEFQHKVKLKVLNSIIYLKRKNEVIMKY